MRSFSGGQGVDCPPATKNQKGKKNWEGKEGERKGKGRKEKEKKRERRGKKKANEKRGREREGKEKEEEREGNKHCFNRNININNGTNLPRSSHQIARIQYENSKIFQLLRGHIPPQTSPAHTSMYLVLSTTG